MTRPVLLPAWIIPGAILQAHAWTGETYRVTVVDAHAQGMTLRSSDGHDEFHPFTAHTKFYELGRHYRPAPGITYTGTYGGKPCTLRAMPDSSHGKWYMVYDRDPGCGPRAFPVSCGVTITGVRAEAAQVTA